MVFAVPRPLAQERQPLGAIFNFLSDEAHGKRANYMAHPTEWFSASTSSLSSIPASFSLYPAYLIFFIFFVVVLFFFLLVLAHVRNCPESMRNAKKIFLQFSRRRRKWTTIMRISSESSVWSEFVTSTEHDGEGGRRRVRGGCRKKSESRRPTQCAAVSCDSVPLCLSPLPSQEPEGHASIE